MGVGAGMGEKERRVEEHRETRSCWEGQLRHGGGAVLCRLRRGSKNGFRQRSQF